MLRVLREVMILDYPRGSDVITRLLIREKKEAGDSESEKEK